RAVHALLSLQWTDVAVESGVGRVVEEVGEAELHCLGGIVQRCGESVDEWFEGAGFWFCVAGFPAGDLVARESAGVGELLLGQSSSFAPVAQPGAVEGKAEAGS